FNAVTLLITGRQVAKPTGLQGGELVHKLLLRDVVARSVKRWRGKYILPLETNLVTIKMPLDDSSNWMK
ncbi:MAG: hypothetical protein ACRDBM_17755, partial [Sporomusa sp.]